MTDAPDAELLERFARDNSETAFAALVERHLGLVHSVALRHTANPQHAQDITQAVFIILARKAAALNRKTVLPGWLYHTARLTAANFQRAETRRIRREQEAYMQSTLTEAETANAWTQMSPLLDEAMSHLRAGDRDALVLRYFQNKSLPEVGAAMGLAERAAQKRVLRAVEKLRKFFVKRGVTLSSTALTGAVSTNSIQAAPAMLAKTTTAVAFAKGTTVSSSTLTLIKGALKVMAWTKAKTAVVVSVGVLFVAGTATVTVKEIQARQIQAWQKKFDLAVVDRITPQVTIRPSPPSRQPPDIHLWGARNGKILAFGHRVEDLAMVAYPGNYGQLIFSAPVPEGEFDYIANLPVGTHEALQKEMKRKFGLVGRRELIETNVLVLTVRSTKAPGLRRGVKQPTFDEGPDFVTSHGQTILAFVDYLRRSMGTIVIDRTGLQGSFDIDLKWDSTPDDFQRVLREQLGLELTPGTESVEFFIIEKAK